MSTESRQGLENMTIGHQAAEASVDETGEGQVRKALNNAAIPVTHGRILPLRLMAGRGRSTATEVKIIVSRVKIWNYLSVRVAVFRLLHVGKRNTESGRASQFLPLGDTSRIVAAMLG